MVLAHQGLTLLARRELLLKAFANDCTRTAFPFLFNMPIDPLITLVHYTLVWRTQ